MKDTRTPAARAYDRCAATAKRRELAMDAARALVQLIDVTPPKHERNAREAYAWAAGEVVRADRAYQRAVTVYRTLGGA